MAEHDDLFAAALDAVTAVEAHASRENSREDESKDSAPQTDQSSQNEIINEDQLEKDVDALLADSSASNSAEGVLDDDLDINFSLSGFAGMFGDPEIGTGGIDFSLNELGDEKSEIVEDKANEQIAELEAMVAELQAQLQAAQQKSADLQVENDQLRVIQKQFNDRLIRVSADFDNYRKRVARDQELNKNQAEERIVTGFLPVMDNLERALIHARQSDDYQQLLQGVEMTSKLYLGALAKLGCMPYESLGAEFDPVYHDVLQRVVDEEKPHNSIIQEHLKGYTMHDRVLRPALVVVAQHEGSDNEGEV